MNVKSSVLKSILFGLIVSLSAPLFSMEAPAQNTQAPAAPINVDATANKQPVEHAPEASLFAALVLRMFKEKSKGTEKSNIEDKSEGYVKDFENWWSQSTDINKVMAVGLLAISSFFLLNTICKPKNAQGQSSSLLSMLFGGLGLLGLKDPIATRMEKDQQPVKDFFTKEQGIDLGAGEDYAENLTAYYSVYKQGNTLLQTVKGAVSIFTAGIFTRPAKNSQPTATPATQPATWQPEVVPAAPVISSDAVVANNSAQNNVSPINHKEGKQEVDVPPSLVAPSNSTNVQQPSSTGWFGNSVNWLFNTVDNALQPTVPVAVVTPAAPQLVITNSVVQNNSTQTQQNK